jgi:microcystin-dependent protein
MPRNSQGLYTLPLPPVLPNTLIESQWANPTLDDIASALTASLPRDGSAPMTGALTLAAGDPTNARHATSKAYVDKFMAYATGMPLGAVFAFAPNAVPSGYLLCDGQAVSRTTYADLFAAIGTTFGGGDGVATFNVPDMRDWFIRGRNPTTRTIGSTQAASLASHTHAVSDPGHVHTATQAAHSHAVSDPAHSHGVSDPGHVHGGNRAQGGSSTFSGAGFNNGIENSAAAVTGVTVTAAYTGIGVEATQPAITVQSANTGLQVGAAGGVETVPQNIAMDYYIKAVNDSAVTGIVTGIDTSDPDMIAIDNTNPTTPVLDIQSNLPFGIPKLDLNGQISISQLPAGVQTFLGTFDCSGGQNPSEKFPTETFVNGNTYLVAVGGTITVYNPATNTAAPTAIDLGWNLVWVSNPDQPIGWYFIEAPTVTAATAASVAFVPAGTIGATNVQAAIQELDSETQAALSGKASLGNAVPAMNGTAAPGVAIAASRTDHVHPTDTSRAPTSAGTAIGTSFTPVGNLVATNVQAALAELDSEKAPASAGTATGTSFTPAGNVAATNVQAAIQELDVEKQSLLGYVPVNQGGDTMSGGLTIQNALLTVSQSAGNNKSIQLGGQSALGFPYFWSPEGTVQCASNLLLTSIPSTANAANCHIATGENNSVYLSTSSRRFKKDIEPLTAYPGFDSIQPVTFKSLHEHDGDNQFLGFISEDLYAVDARLGDGDTFYDDRAMLAILFAEVKCLRKRVEELEAKCATC